MAEAIKVQGLREFRRDLGKLSADLPKALRLVMNDAANAVVDDAKPRVPTRSGKARASVKARSTQTAVRVVGGGTRVPYYPWLDFGGRVGRGRSVRRAFMSDGRYLYAAYYDQRDELERRMVAGLVDVAAQAGIEVEA